MYIYVGTRQIGWYMYKQVDAQVSKYIGKQMDGWIDGWMDGLMYGWMDGWMDGWIDRQSTSPYSQCDNGLSLNSRRSNP